MWSSKSLLTVNRIHSDIEKQIKQNKTYPSSALKRKKICNLQTLILKPSAN